MDELNGGEEVLVNLNKSKSNSIGGRLHPSENSTIQKVDKQPNSLLSSFAFTSTLVAFPIIAESGRTRNPPGRLGRARARRPVTRPGKLPNTRIGWVLSRFAFPKISFLNILFKNFDYANSMNLFFLTLFKYNQILAFFIFSYTWYVS